MRVPQRFMRFGVGTVAAVSTSAGSRSLSMSLFQALQRVLNTRVQCLQQSAMQYCSRVTSQPIGVTALRLHKKEKVLEVSFTDGSTRRFSAELLRVCSPSAENCSEGANSKVVAGRRHVGIMGLELVGNYAVRLSFDDLHHTGLYTWDYLHDLGHHKYSRAKQYIQALRQHGHSRDPRKRTPRPK